LSLPTSRLKRCEVRNMVTHKSILTIDKIVFVNMGLDDQPSPHGCTEATLDNGSP
jgi:acyl-CoA thioesterase YciA